MSNILAPAYQPSINHSPSEPSFQPKLNLVLPHPSTAPSKSSVILSTPRPIPKCVLPVTHGLSLNFILVRPSTILSPKKLQSWNDPSQLISEKISPRNNFMVSPRKAEINAKGDLFKSTPLAQKKPENRKITEEEYYSTVSTGHKKRPEMGSVSKACSTGSISKSSANLVSPEFVTNVRGRTEGRDTNEVVTDSQGLGVIKENTLEGTKENMNRVSGLRYRRTISNPTSAKKTTKNTDNLIIMPELPPIPNVTSNDSDLAQEMKYLSKTINRLNSRSTPGKPTKLEPDVLSDRMLTQDPKRNLIKLGSKKRLKKEPRTEAIARRSFKRTVSSLSRRSSFFRPNLPDFGGEKLDEENLKSLFQKTSFDKPVSLVKLKEFWKNLNHYLGMNLPHDDRLFENIFKQCDIDNTGRIELEHLRVFLSFYALKLRISPLADDIVHHSFPRNVVLMKEMYHYVNVSYDSEKDKPLLFKFWQECFPDYDVPSIPSDQWKMIGFQNSDPQTDFRGAGRFGLQCLLALTKQKNFFHSVRSVIEGQDLSFVLASINVLGLIFDYIGWGYKTPQVPYGEKIQTYRGLLDLLFDVNIDTSELSKAMLVSRKRFQKLYFMCMGLLSRDIKRKNTTYLEFPYTLAATSNEIEDILSTKVHDEISLNKYLFETFNLDPILLFDTNEMFYIFLYTPNQREIVSIPNTMQTLHNILENISQSKNLPQYQPFYLSGQPIEKLDIPISNILPSAIYCIPLGEELQPLITKVEAKSTSSSASPENPSTLSNHSKSLNSSRSSSPLRAHFTSFSSVKRKRAPSFLSKKNS